MNREISKNLKGKIHVEKITNEPFDDIIGHSEVERKVFTIENNDIIYRRFREELKMQVRPYLGPCVDFGLGDFCIEEAKDCFKFYTIDRGTKDNYEEFDNVEGAIQKLMSFYRKYNIVNDPDKMEEIFYETLGLEKKEKTTEDKGHVKTLRQNK